MKPRCSLSVLAVAAAILLLAGCTAAEGSGAAAAAADPLPAEAPVLPAKVLQPGQAVLVRGSEAVRGIPGFGRNAIPALFGEYALELDGSGVQLVSVWFTREPVVLDEDWGPFFCPGLPAGLTLSLSDTAGEGQLVLASSTAGYRLVISFPAGFGSPCRFISVFVERFMFFMRNAAREEDLSLPAFLQL